MIWFYPIDWNLTVASFSALTAAVAVAWNVVWSHQQQKQAALTRIAETRLKWIDEFRDVVSDYIAMVVVQTAKNQNSGTIEFDPIHSQKMLRAYHDILMRLPAGQPHFDSFRTTIYEALNGISEKPPEEVHRFAVTLETTAIAVIEAERAVAKIELSGGFKK